jgi:hypothetical protein
VQGVHDRPLADAVQQSLAHPIAIAGRLGIVHVEVLLASGPWLLDDHAQLLGFSA